MFHVEQINTCIFNVPCGTFLFIYVNTRSDSRLINSTYYHNAKRQPYGKGRSIKALFTCTKTVRRLSKTSTSPLPLWFSLCTLFPSPLPICARFTCTVTFVGDTLTRPHLNLTLIVISVMKAHAIHELKNVPRGTFFHP